MAVFRQERHVELVPGASEAFIVANEMYSASIPAQLPHLNVFVITVNDVADAKQDVLARVANLADLSLLPIGRDAGIAAPSVNGIEYLSPTCTVQYTTLETATDAAVAFRDRVNALITAWVAFRTDFNAPDPTPASYTFPAVDPSQQTALITAYTLAKQTRYTDQLAKTEADAALARAQAAYTATAALTPDVTTLSADVARVQAGLATTITQFGALYTASSTFYGANVSGTGNAAMLTALTAAAAQQAAMPGYTADGVTAAVDMAAYLAARQADVTTAATALTTAQATQLAAAQTLTSRLATEAAALAAVLAVCPDFDKHSIPFVPDDEP